ncbi:MAG: hypothetical protein RL497_193, partial [Pseudomonadota bacterium]
MLHSINSTLLSGCILIAVALLSACNGTPVSSSSSSTTRQDNPFAGAKRWYVNPTWSDNVKRDGGDKVAGYNTGVWMDRVDTINYEGLDPTAGTGLREHLDEALRQRADLFQLVLYNVPGRNCARATFGTELPASAAGMNTYKKDYIDRITSILGEEKYADIRIVAIIEADSLVNLVVNSGVIPCNAVNNSNPWGYTEGVRYALTQLAKLKNVYSYLDIGHAGQMGADLLFSDGVKFFADVIAGGPHAGPTPAPGWGAISGFISNTANYTPLIEPYLANPAEEIGGKPLYSSRFYDGNRVFGELEFSTQWREAMLKAGAPKRIGQLIDTARNGWGGPKRPGQKASGTDVDKVVDASRIDRRPQRYEWCNQESGIGERPIANPRAGIHAYVWARGPGESDGVSN